MTLREPIVEPASPLSRAETFHHQGFRVPDPFAPRHRPGASFVHALLATTLFRCWHILLFFSAWSTLITILCQQGHKLTVQPTLLTVVGTVLGFIISYRTTSSFERYNEGRRLWSQIIYASRTFARTVWFHVPQNPPTEGMTTEEAKARTLIEKKSVVNLLEAFAVAMKHYLRGEDGIYYQDLYYLVKFLPAYALPAGLPSMTDLSSDEESEARPVQPLATPMSNAFPSPTSANSPRQQSFSNPTGKNITIAPMSSVLFQRNLPTSPDSLLPAPVTVNSPGQRSSFLETVTSGRKSMDKERFILNRHDEAYLMPSSMPPKWAIFDFFPFSLLVQHMTKQGKSVKGKKGARVRAKLRHNAIGHNLPLELSLYLSSYIAKLQERKQIDVPTTNTLIAALNQLVDSLTGLERILTTPIPFSYLIHLWVVTILYYLALPFQIYSSLKWVTIPATIIISFIFFGFLVAGEEIENPFGYDKNDLNLDHFTHNIIRNELKAITSTPPPDPTRWAFVPENNLLFFDTLDERVTPQEWISRGRVAMQRNLSHF
ncbi:Bestrophin, RFP-TM, chloride channel-domain-containing protein [Gymnopilus junonius]|uniref:Bestrophin, RFP-TM, chloride channel-domain-containing protein n=1 Tax=Gymnopilus junonius TaxID=109634 RepID=A0A9P5NTK4_GYMJU|nr:Bestrophin, RFP-TM, chloride channel-domain-containing protein [Gymnopilus junonius]